MNPHPSLINRRFHKNQITGFPCDIFPKTPAQHVPQAWTWLYRDKLQTALAKGCGGNLVVSSVPTPATLHVATAWTTALLAVPCRRRSYCNQPLSPSLHCVISPWNCYHVFFTDWIQPTLTTLVSDPQSKSAIDLLCKLLQARWDPVTKLLDLAWIPQNLAQDKILKAAGIAAPGQKGTPIRTAGAIWKLSQEICPSVQSISLADNQMQSLQATPHVDQNSGHHIPGAHKSVAIQKPTNFVFQAQHALTHHPQSRLMQRRERRAVGLQSYLFELLRRFPSLEVLDGEAIDPVVKARMATTAQHSMPSTTTTTTMNVTTPGSAIAPHTTPHPLPPLPIKPAYFNDASTSSFLAAFCVQFFNAFDQDRASLMDISPPNPPSASAFPPPSLPKPKPPASPITHPNA
ncbi:hypothetical protein PCASD_11720 [Puccinia coronata f. sp. avenae]|uniref:Uncharacterized protein n=1 Tax=Puccinia coronata f. sp. avenae TaxID=200324 RepID=A0A2N5UMC7_9BASI|nr:hypothetical protein PCASD_11720 [Puccinia coronata f. sp. avenae]